MWFFFWKTWQFDYKVSDIRQKITNQMWWRLKKLQFDYEVLDIKVARKMSWDETLLVGHFKFECLGENLI
jgi:hypothetical protein